MSYLSLRSRRTARRAATASLAALLLTVAACSSSGSVKSSSDASLDSSPAGFTSEWTTTAKADIAKFSTLLTSYPAITPITGASKLKGKTVWFVPIGAAVPNIAAYGVAAQQAFAKLGVQWHTCDGKFVPTGVAACLNQAMTQGADGVIAAFIDYHLVPTAFDSLASHHIPVLLAGEPAIDGKPDSSALSSYDTAETSYLVQKLQDEAVILRSNGTAKILFVGITDSPQTRGITTYSENFFKQNCPGCTFTQIGYGAAATSKLASQVSAALIAHPDTDYVIPAFDSEAGVILSGVQSAGFANKVQVASSDGSLDALQRIASGGAQFLDVGASPAYEGWTFADGMMRMLLGIVPSPILNPPRLFTKDNVSGLSLTPAAYTTNDWYGSDDYQQTFLTAWGQ